MADAVLQSCVTEILARIDAYTFPDNGNGAGTWTVNGSHVNPTEISKLKEPRAFLYINPVPGAIEMENVQQWLVRQEMTAQLRMARIKNQYQTAIKILPYWHMCLAQNTSGTIDPLLNGYAFNQNFRDGQVVFGNAKTPFIDLFISFEVEYTYAIDDPTSVI